MQWYYSAGGQQQGPVSQAILESLAQAGTVTPDTLVWRDGMADWAAYSSIVPSTATNPAAAGVAQGTAHCAECGLSFSKDDMVEFQNVHICATCKPVYFQKLREGVNVGGAAIWRHKKNVVTALNPVLPMRCVKCNAPANPPQLKRTVYWHHPLVYLALVGRIILYVIVAMIVRKRSTVIFSVCPEHRAKRRNAIIVSWLLVVGGIAATIAGFANESGWIGGIGGVAFLGGVIYGIVKGRLVYATKIDKEHLWLGGCGKNFLAELPEWKGA